MSEFQYRGRYNEELAERYKWGEFEQRVKDDAASAKRLATQLTSAVQRFDHLAPEHQLSLNAAANTARLLAQELERLKPWAKAFSIWRAAERAREALEQLDRRAAERWAGDDAATRVEAADLLEFLAQGPAVDEWAAAKWGVADCQLVTDVSSGVNALARRLKSALEGEDRDELRRAAASLIERFIFGHGDETRVSHWGAQSGSTYRVLGLRDFEAWRASKTVAERVTAAALGKLGHAPAGDERQRS